MFYNCNSLTNINLSNFDTQNVNNMSCMFLNCNKEIKDIDGKYFDEMKNINIIESPLFKLLSKTKNFGKIFKIYISQEFLDKF